MSLIEYAPHEKRIFKLMSEIETHIDRSVKLDDLARQVCYSTHHFDRIFGETIGQTPMDYLRQRRLQRACLRIRHEQTSILQIALETGFSSNATFSRAFRQQFDLSPRDWRNGAWRGFMADLHSQSKEIDPISMEEQSNWITQREPFRAQTQVASRVVVRLLPAIPYLFHRLIGEKIDYQQSYLQMRIDAQAQGLADENTPSVWVNWGDNAFTRIDRTLSDVGVIPSTAQATGRFLLGQIPAGLYAALDFDGEFPLSKWMHEDWLEQQSAYVFDANKPYFNVFNHDGTPRGTFYLPIQRS